MSTSDDDTRSTASARRRSKSGTGEEEALLQRMINERDEQIEKLTERTSYYDKKIITVRELLTKTRTEAADARSQQSQIIEDYKKKIGLYAAKLASVEKDVIQQNGGLHAYANILKEAAPETADSSYVIRMQAQLCKAMHSMGILEHQLEMHHKFSSGLVVASKAAMNDVREAKTNIELKLMNDLMQVDGGKREMEEKLKQSKYALEQHMSADLDRIREDDGNEDDSEEEIDEDLLKEILDERKEDIQDFQRENAKQLKQIEELTAKIKELQ